MSTTPEWTGGPRVDSRGGVDVATWDLGGQGPPLLLLHATGFHGRMWLPQAPVLRSHFRLWSLDFRGHGASGHNHGGSYLDWYEFVDDALAVIDHLGLADQPDGLALAGHSMGAAVALMIDQARPGSLRTLYCYEPIVLAPEDRTALNDGGVLAAGARRRRAGFASVEAARDNYAAKPPFANFDPAALDAYVRYGLVDQPDGTVRLACEPAEEATVYEGATSTRAWEHLADNRAPAVLAGSTATSGPAARLEEMAARHPAATVQRHPELDHFGPMVDPAGVARAIVDACAPRG